MDREFLDRMDRHMASNGELLREIKAEVELTREEVRLSREQRVHSDALMDRLEAKLDRDAEQHSDLRSFIYEMTVRIERGGRELAREVQRSGQALAQEIRGNTTRMDAILEELRDLREESRAQRGALLKLIDRLGPEPGGAAGAA